MARISEVRTDVPGSPRAKTSEVRENFATIKKELEEIFAIIDNVDVQNNPQFSGLVEADDGDFSGNLNVQGSLSVTGGTFGDFSVYNNIKALTAINGSINANGAKYIQLTHKVGFLFGNLLSLGVIASNGTILAQIPSLTLGSAVFQYIPVCLGFNSVENDSSWIQLVQNGANVDLAVYILEVSGTVSVPNNCAIMFSAFVHTQ